MQRGAVPLTVLVIAVLGWLLRVWPLFLHGALRYPVDYDEGVYFSGASLLAHGHFMYRDFILVHPPAFEYLLAPLTRIGGPTTAFAIGRFATSVVGALNIWLLGALAYRHLGRWPAIVAASLYAIQYDLIVTERAIMLEPVLNFLCISAAIFWLRDPVDDDARPDASPWIAGALLGCALAVKLWAGFAFVACLATPRRGRRGKDVVSLTIGAVGAASVLLLPVFVLAPGSTFRDVVTFQFDRPPDGVTGLFRRFTDLFFDPGHVPTEWSHLAVSAMALGGLAVVVFAGGWRSRMLRFASVWFVVTAAGFVASPTFFADYRANLMPSAILLAAGLTSFALHVVDLAALWARRRVLAAVAAGVIAGVVLLALAATAHEGFQTSDDIHAVAAAVRDQKGCVFSFDPSWLIETGRLPNVRVLGDFAVDGYAAQLQAVIKARRSYSNTLAAFSDPASETLVAQALKRCNVVVLGQRGRRQLGSSLPAFEQAFRRVATTSSDGPDVWVRR